MTERHETQYNVLKFIAGYLSTHGYAPTVREIGAGVGLTAPSTVHGHLSRLERKGFLSRKANQSRGWTITESGYHYLAPIAETELELNLNDDLNSAGVEPIDKEHQFIFQQLNNDLIAEHILPGDELIVTYAQTADVNQLKVYQDQAAKLVVSKAVMPQNRLIGFISAVFRKL